MKMRKPLSNPADRLYQSTTMLVLGASGSGKTTLASSVGVIDDEPSKMLFIDNDNGSGAIKLANPALVPESFNDYVTIVRAVKQAVMSQESPPYKMTLAGQEFEFNGVVIDTLNAVQDIVRAEIKGGYLAKKQIRIQDYGIMLDNLTGLILSLRDLASVKPFHFVVTAQITPEKITISDKEGDASSYHWRASLAGKISSKLPEYFDMVLTTYVVPNTGKRVVFCGDNVTDRGTFIGKMRYGHLMTPPSPSIIPSNGAVTWRHVLKLHGVDVDNPDNIGKLDALNEVSVHWANDPSKKSIVSDGLARSGISEEDALAANGCKNWDDVVSSGITGADFIKNTKG